jgi:uncharacterized membrane protein SpoIIM required for sporulation
MTISNIEAGDPFNVYKDEDAFPMFVRIAMNNVVVMGRTFIYGIAFGIFTLYSLFFNGVMLGCFQTFFFQYNLGWDSILVVWIHGAIEINAIVISGVAGLIIGFGYLFPGTYTRWQSLVRSSKDAAKLIITLIPLIIIAAMLESWLTRHTEMKLWMSLTIICSSLIIFFGYYIFLPWYRFRNNQELEKMYEEGLI